MRSVAASLFLLAGLGPASAVTDRDPTSWSVERFYAELGVLARWAAVKPLVKPLVEPHDVKRQDILLCLLTANSLADKRQQTVSLIVDECIDWAKRQ